MGRHSPWTPEQATAIKDAAVEWIASGKTLLAFCRQPSMPSRRQIDDWRIEDPEFRARLARARSDGFEHLADECLEIADDSKQDTIETETGERCDTEWVQRSKLRIETRLKLLACWDPSRYGDRAHGRRVQIALPVVKSAADLPAAYAAVAHAIAAGEVTQEDVRDLRAILDGYRAAFGEAEMAREIAEMRAKIQDLRDGR